MQQSLLELWRKTHTTVLMINHDVEEAIFLVAAGVRDGGQSGEESASDRD